MVILGEFQLESNVTTSYYELYKSMINVPILGSFIPIVLPALVVIFCLLFAILSVFKLKNKAL